MATVVDSLDDNFLNLLYQDNSDYSEFSQSENLIVIDTRQNTNNVCIEANVCNNCNSTEYFVVSKVAYCKQCSAKIDVQESVDNSVYNSSYGINEHYSVPFKFTGKKSFGNQKKLLSVSANYDKQSIQNIQKEFSNLINGKIPKNIIGMACKLFLEINKQHDKVFRKDVKKGLMAACLAYSCNSSNTDNMSKTSKEITDICNVTIKSLNNGIKIIKALKEKSVISIDQNNCTTDFVMRCLDKLNIDKKWLPFIIELIEKANQSKLHIIFDCKYNTRALGATYCLIDRHPDFKHITKEFIEETCGVSKNTFVKYYNNVIVNYYNKYKNIFKKYGVPMRSEWRF